MRNFQKASPKIEVIGTCPKSILSPKGTMVLQGLIYNPYIVWLLIRRQLQHVFECSFCTLDNIPIIYPNSAYDTNILKPQYFELVQVEIFMYRIKFHKNRILLQHKLFRWCQSPLCPFLLIGQINVVEMSITM